MLYANLAITAKEADNATKWQIQNAKRLGILAEHVTSAA
jgi:hypothetical protein